MTLSGIANISRPLYKRIRSCTSRPAFLFLKLETASAHSAPRTLARALASDSPVRFSSALHPRGCNIGTDKVLPSPVVDSIVRRMGGKLDVTSRFGVGTTMTISLPLDVIVANSTKQSLRLERSPKGTIERNISAELAQMIPERSGAASTGVSAMDFESTVNTTQESLRNAPPSARPLRPSLARQASERADEEALVVDVAKLTFSSAVTTPNGAAVPMQDPLQDQPVSPAADDVRKPEPDRPKLRVLIAEDNPISRNILIKLLTGKVSQRSSSGGGSEN